MLVVLSDLHFEEESSSQIIGDGTRTPLKFQRNLPAAPFRKLIAQLAVEAKRNAARRLDFVLAGDIFDLHRTTIWFTETPPALRPYQSTATVDQDLEALLLRIISGIVKEKNVAEILGTFQLLAAGKFVNDNHSEEEFPVPVDVHYLPGNHDRMANATPAIRQAVRQALGLHEHGALFPNVISFDQEQTLVRHGHEYDYTNFSMDHRDTMIFPVHLPPEQYQEPCIGDFATIDIASHLPFLFRQYHGDEKILADHTLRTLYLRLLEFDDLRPITAIFNYFIYAEGQMIDKRKAWAAAEPVVILLLEALHDDPFLLASLAKLDKRWCLDMIDAIQAVLAARPWRWTNSHIPLDLAEAIAQKALASTAERPGVERYAARESSIRNGQHRFLVAGHTHRPQVSLIANDNHGDRYYVDTGTWRNRVAATPDYRQFGQLKTLSYVIIYGPNEDRGAMSSDRIKIASFDFWIGLTQGWERDRLGIKPLDRSR
ncbi:MAG: metallophosphoesterase [Candidatus Promineifilaceae bacterium]|nr:metallophosphoesterase [Candidatus Promineifilaceae bacterium]